MHLDRREFLGAAIAGAPGLLLADRLVAAGARSDPTAVVPLGRELKVTRLGIGTGMRGVFRQSDQTRLGPEKFDRLLQYAYDQNVRLIDMADLYGSHEHVARALRGKPRDSYTLVSKIWFRPGALPEPERPDADVCVRRFLKELNTDYIDLVQIHCMTSGTWPQEMRKQMDLLDDLKRKGMIRAHGVSIHSLDAMEAAANEPWVDVMHARVNIYHRKTDGPIEKIVPILKRVHAAGKGVIAMKLSGEGTFDARQRETNLRYVMGLDSVSAMIVGFEKPEEIDQFKTNMTQILAAVPSPFGRELG